MLSAFSNIKKTDRIHSLYLFRKTPAMACTINLAG
jgi:hypothetical protein